MARLRARGLWASRVCADPTRFARIDGEQGFGRVGALHVTLARSSERQLQRVGRSGVEVGGSLPVVRQVRPPSLAAAR
jgi:hypothetical protein